MRIVAKSLNTKTPAFKGLLSSRVLKSGLEFASNNGVLFSGATCVVMSSIVRPLAILITPSAKKEDKQYASTRSIISGILGFGVMAGITTPIVKAVHNLMKQPKKYLDTESMKFFKKGVKTLGKSKTFNFASQMVKLSSAFLTSIPKAYITCALIPPLMNVLFNKTDDKKVMKRPSFKGRLTDVLSKGVGKVMDLGPVQKFADKFKDTNLPQHLFALNDIFATGLFVHFTHKNKNIEENRKKTLCYNAVLTTGLTIPISYGVAKLLDKPTEKFIKKFSEANKGDKKLSKYIEGIKIAKPALILGTLYYAVAPVVSTFLADKLSNTNKGNS